MKKLVDTCLTLAKVALRSRPVGRPASHGPGKTLIVMGNGPSLSETISAHADILNSFDTMAVNFAANTGEYFKLRPRHYVLADPHFFSSFSRDANVGKLWENLSKTDWPMALHLPAGKEVPLEVRLPGNVETRRFNMTPGDGYAGVCHRLYRSGLAMPRPRNVLIPALMEGIRDGYGKIYIVGADHTWPHTLYVDDRNRVVTVQPHFYKEDPKELDRIAEAYAGVHIHDVLGSMTVAFRSYHRIQEYAGRRGVEIFNATPDSLIDAFPRKTLDSLRQETQK